MRRRLTLRHIVFIGLVYMAPLAVFDTFGIAADASGNQVPASYLLVVVAVVITACSYARMERHYPSAGSAYTYAKEAIHPHVGFMVGWATRLAYLFLPMLNALLSAVYLGGRPGTSRRGCGSVQASSSAPRGTLPGCSWPRA